MVESICCDASSKTDQSVWAAFNPLTQTMISAPTREEFQRLYLCDTSSWLHERRREKSQMRGRNE